MFRRDIIFSFDHLLIRILKSYISPLKQHLSKFVRIQVGSLISYLIAIDYRNPSFGSPHISCISQIIYKACKIHCNSICSRPREHFRQAKEIYGVGRQGFLTIFLPRSDLFVFRAIIYRSVEISILFYRGLLSLKITVST